jgi:hypothetical protein
MSIKRFLFAACGVLCIQGKAVAHAPAPLRVPLHLSLSAHHASLTPLNFHFSSKATALNYRSLLPVSGSSKAFAENLKLITGGTIKNTVLYAPLQNVSGQISSVNYYSETSGYPTTFYSYPSFNAFGSNPLNVGGSGNVVTIMNFSNTLSTNLKPVSIFPFTEHSALSGAQRSLLGYYNLAASNGYNAGIKILQNPTGGLFYGTSYYYPTGNVYSSYREFYAFGSSPYAQASVASSFFGGSTLSAPLTSYLQFGKLTRIIHNGLLVGTDYYPYSYSSPIYAGYPGPYYNQGANVLAIGSNPLNTGVYGNSVTLSPYLTSFFK